jgi:hypothetical protein
MSLWRNDGPEDWSVEINGVRHEHVCAQEMEDLVEATVVVAEPLPAEQHSGAPISELTSPSTKWVEVTRSREMVTRTEMTLTGKTSSQDSF